MLQKTTVPNDTRTAVFDERNRFNKAWFRFFQTLSNSLNEMSDETGAFQFPVFTDANRPLPGTAGRVIFNTTDGNLNIDNGTNWILPDGTIT